MFKKAMQGLVKELDDSGELKPLTSIIESMDVDLLSVVKVVESSKMLFFKELCYRHTGFKLQELLQSKDTVDFGGNQKKMIGAVNMKEEGQGSGRSQYKNPFLMEAAVKTDMHRTESTSEMEVERVSMNRAIIHEVLQNSTVDENHILMQEMRRNRKAKGLGVIYQIIKTKNPVILRKTIKGKGSMKFSALNNTTVEIAGKGAMEKKLKLEAGCVLGFKVHCLPLKIKKDSIESQAMVSDGVAEFAEEFTGDFPAMKRRLEAELRRFREMNLGVKKCIWGPLSKILMCPQALYALDCMLEEGCLCTGSPSPLDKLPEDLRLSVQNLLQVVGLDSFEDFDPFDLLNPLGLLVSTLAELDEETVTLIIGLDSEVRGQVLELVEGVLELVCSQDGGDPQWSERFSGNTMTVATEVLMSCGLKLGEDLGCPEAPDVALLALYITLKGMNMLLEP